VTKIVREHMHFSVKVALTTQLQPSLVLPGVQHSKIVKELNVVNMFV